MKKVVLWFAIFLSPLTTLENVSASGKMQWWRDARFGMFIHWGIYSVPAKGEWYMTDAHVPLREYEKYASQFNPVDFDADSWARLAHDAGMRYLIITAKHHDGFCMFNTRMTKYNVVHATPWHMDPLKLLSKACKRYKIKFGVYYSIMDWHSPDQEANVPDSARPTYNPTHFKPGRKAAYINYMKRQLKELVSQYNPAVLWFDGGWMDGWTAADGRGIYNYLRKLDPRLIINDRVIGAGDYETPEQQIPASGIAGKEWETCMTINDSWGFNAADSNFKSATTLLRNLVDIVSKGGNYLLNVGPTSQGTVPKSEVQVLKEIGQWLRRNGGSIYGTTASPFAKRFQWGYATQKGTDLFLQIFDWPIDGRVVLHGIYNLPKKVFVLSDKRKVSLSVTKDGDALVVRTPQRPPEEWCSVIELHFGGRILLYNPPQIIAEDTLFIDSLQVNISPKFENAVARYSVQSDITESTGTEPTPDSPEVSGPIRINNSSIVSARYFVGDLPVSETEKAAFVKVNVDSPVVVGGTLRQGLLYKYYEGEWQIIPDFSKLKPIRQGELRNFSLPPQRSRINYGIEYKGYMRIPSKGVYTFYVSSDDGSKLYIDGKLIVDNDGLHGPVEKAGKAALSSGYHQVELKFFQAGGSDELRVFYKRANTPKQEIPDAQLYY
jgi:alpha-L-fucosidase